MERSPSRERQSFLFKDADSRKGRAGFGLGQIEELKGLPRSSSLGSSGALKMFPRGENYLISIINCKEDGN